MCATQIINGVKINTVVQKQSNFDELAAFVVHKINHCCCL